MTTKHATIPTNRLFALIVRFVADNRHAPLTVREIAAELDVPPGVVASCVALHSAPLDGVIDPQRIRVLAEDTIVDTLALGLVARLKQSTLAAGGARA